MIIRLLLRSSSYQSNSSLRLCSRTKPLPLSFFPYRPGNHHCYTPRVRFYATPTSTTPSPSHSHTPRNPVIEAKIAEIEDLFFTAKDEFEIATEETDKKTVYAADDRAAAVEELGKVKGAFGGATEGEGGDEIRRRIGGRIRELEAAVDALEVKGREE